MGQVAQKTFGLYSELVIRNEMCYGESYLLPNLITIINSFAFSPVIHKRWPETQPNNVKTADNINKVYHFSIVV